MIALGKEQKFQGSFKEINGVWYKIGNTLGFRPTNNGDINNIEDDKEYKVVLKFSSLGIIDGITKGKYRLYSISDNELNKNIIKQ